MEEVDLNMQSLKSSISVVIPVKNGYPEIKECIQGILSQTIPVSEILAIDSGSTDGTVAYLKTVEKVRLIQIEPAEFNHGSTRNLGWQNCDSEFLVYTVQDARPANKVWIEDLMKGFTDEEVVAVCGQQIVPHERDKNPVEWFRHFSQPEIKRYQFKTADEFESLDPAQQKSICSWDNVTAMYRNSILKAIPFKRAVFGEDMIWAKQALLQGHAIVYNGNAKVYHYHLENENFVFKRAFTTMYFRYKEFRFLYNKPLLPLRTKLSMLKTLAIALNFNIAGIIKWYRFNTDNFKAAVKAYEQFMKYLDEGEASLDAAHERFCGQPPVPLKSNK